ncbi:hypothetical protein WJ542_24190 [Paraburkholderia sp. B3]|uniref:hypothetical protein n=1 Tax=Paraburkholderia sp. B3 TaxID=3134791 RepID=UPI003982B2BA
MKPVSLLAIVLCAACLGTPTARADSRPHADADANAKPVVHAVPHARAHDRDNLPFSFRGIPLGIPLEALRASSMVRATPHESTLVCETDVLGGDIGMLMKSRASPTVACRWAHRTLDGWAPSQAVVAGAPAADHVLRFAHDAPGEPLRLYEMSFVVDRPTALDLRNMLASRYGAPHLHGDTTLPLFEWENASSTITLCLLPDGDRATLTYTLKSVSPHPASGMRTMRVSQFDEG